MTLRSQADNPTEANVAVLGAGQTGAAAVSYFAPAGFRVALIDQRRNSATITKSMASMFTDSARHPFATVGWAVDCVSGAVELATQIAISSERIA